MSELTRPDLPYSYPEYFYSNFPQQVDYQNLYEDVGVETADAIDLYYKYISSKNFVAASQLLADNPLLQRCVINAKTMTVFEHRILAIQRFYLESVAKYDTWLASIENHLALISNILDVNTVNKLSQMLKEIQEGTGLKSNGFAEMNDVVVRTGAITAASGTVTFKTPFDTMPYVFIPMGGTVTIANTTLTGFTYSGSAANRFWVAIADNSD